MARRTGIQAELLTSLGLVMVLATVVQAAVLAVHHERSLRELLGRALVAEARAPAPGPGGVVTGSAWWTLHPEGQVRPRNSLAGSIDPLTRELAESARARGEVLMRPGAPWERIRLATPVGDEGLVAVVALPREASFRMRFWALGVLLAILLADVAIFSLLGVRLLRGRVVLPLQRLAATARAISEGAAGVRARVEGTAEAAALAVSFNEMTDALERRKEALEKAVGDLRERNRELSQARAGLDRAERLAAVGRLASGVAHEIGNPIGAILALVDLAARDPGLGEASRGHLERAGREGLRVRAILRQLLDFSRPPRPTPAPLDVAAAAREAVALVEAQRRYASVAFQVERDPRTPVALADGSAVLQILVNLLLNAGDALRGRDAGRVLLEVAPAVLATRSGEAGRAADRAAAARRAPDAVECRVSDDGPGIAPEHRERVFDPFFTTKPPGEGTGLGLANAARLAEELGGSLSLTDPPEGFATSFSLRLPALPAGAPGVRARAAQESAHRADPSSSEPEVASILPREAAGAGAGSVAGEHQMREHTPQRSAKRGFTVVEVVVVMAIVAIAAAAAIPAWRNVTANNRLREASHEVSHAMATARARAISSGNNVVVYFNTGINVGDDICGNPLVDTAGTPVPVLVFDDGPPGNPTANCCIDAGDMLIEAMNVVPGVGWGTQLAAGPAPNDPDLNVNFANGPTFRDPNGNSTEWVMFRPDGIPVGFQDNGGPCNPGSTGTGQGAIYLTNNQRDASVVLNALGGLRVHQWERSGGAWTN